MCDTADRIRVALLTHGFHIGGGVPSVARWLACGLRATGGFDVDIFDLATSSKDGNSRRLASASTWRRRSLCAVCPHRECHRHTGANAVEIEVMRYRPRKELTRTLQEYHVVQVVAGSPAWAAVARDVRVPVVLQAATTVAWERGATHSSTQPLLQRWRRTMTRMTTAAERMAVMRADVVLVENQEMAEHVRDIGQARVYVAPPGVDLEVFRPAYPPPAGGYLLSVCRLGDPRKGLDRLIHAYHVMTQRRRDVPDLVLAGRGPLYAPVLSLIERLGLTRRVGVHCDVPSVELADLYRGASVFLQASHEEGLGIAVLEAMASGLPVVATTTAGSKQTVCDGITGWLVDQLDEKTLPSRFADRVLAALSQEGQAFGRAARDLAVNRFSTTATLRRYIEVYQEVLTDKRTHANRQG